jgi:hypothetical protein
MTEHWRIFHISECARGVHELSHMVCTPRAAVWLNLSSLHKTPFG